MTVPELYSCWKANVERVWAGHHGMGHGETLVWSDFLSLVPRVLVTIKFGESRVVVLVLKFERGFITVMEEIDNE